MIGGYARALRDGEIATLRALAVACAGSFGVRSIDGELPTDLPVDLTELDESLATAEARLAELRSLSPERCEAEATLAHEACARGHAAYQRQLDAERDRCRQLRSLTTAWRVPLALQPLRESSL